MNSAADTARYSERSSVTQSRADDKRVEHSTAHATHLDIKGSPSVTHTRVQALMSKLGSRSRFALSSGVTA